jgi:hypothetical protein
MNIIGIDPGTESGAVVVWDTLQRQIVFHEIMPNNELLEWLRNQDDANDVSCETIISLGQRVGAETFETCFFIGRIMEICHRRKQVFTPIRRRDVIMVHCASNKASDADVRAAMIAYVGQPGSKKAPGPTYGIASHEWSALAIATFLQAQEETDQKLADLRALRAKPVLNGV